MRPCWSGCRAKIDWYDRKARANQRAYKVSKISIIVLAILIPVFAEYGFVPGFHDTRAFLVRAASGAIALLAERTSSLVMAEHGKWAHAREAKTETTVSG